MTTYEVSWKNRDGSTEYEILENRDHAEQRANFWRTFEKTDVVISRVLEQSNANLS